MSDDYTEAAQALSHISPNCPRDEWWPILAGLKSAFGDNAYGLAHDWSAGGDTFNAQDFNSTWRSLSNGGITVKTVFKRAIDEGWKPDGSSKPMPKPPRPKLPPPQSKTRDYAIELRTNMNRNDPDVAHHPYAVSKGIDWACGAGVGKANGRLIGRGADCIVVPMRALDGPFTGVECINTEGKKQTFGNKGVLQLGNTLDLALPIYIVEGWADAASVWRTMGNVVVIAAFGKSNMEKTYDALTGRDRTLVEDAA